MSKPDRVFMKLAVIAMANVNGDRKAAFSEYIKLRWRHMGQLGPGCDAKEFYKAVEEVYAINDALYEFMREHDDVDAPDCAWQAMLEDAVHLWNKANKTKIDSNYAFQAYVERKGNEQTSSNAMV